MESLLTQNVMYASPNGMTSGTFQGVYSAKQVLCTDSQRVKVAERLQEMGDHTEMTKGDSG